jgi:uncharacterized protein (DUF3820 family)
MTEHEKGGSVRMPFGKHAGEELSEVPKQYLHWLRSQPWMKGGLVKEIDEVLNVEAEASTDESFEEVLKTWKEDENE